MKKLAFLLLFVFGNLFAQNTINNYKYLVVPVRFTIQKEPQQYGLNVLTKNYFEQLGFQVFMSDEVAPNHVAHCDKIFLDVTGSNNMIRTTLKITITDCNQKILLISPEFSDRDKSNQIAFSKALRAALKSIGEKGYAYESPAVSSITTDNAASTATTVMLHADFESVLLYAQPVPGGFQLIDTVPKVVLRIFTTSCPDMYTATDGVQAGIFYKSADKWIFEYLLNGEKMYAKFQVRF